LKAFRRREVHLLSDADKLKRLTASKRLLRRLTKAKLTRTWFSDEKVFSVQTTTNSQKDRVYANTAVKCDVPVARLLKRRKHFSQKIMVSVAVSNLGKTSLMFVQPGAKVDSSYYCNVVLNRVYYQTFRSCLVITSLFNSCVFESSCTRICGTTELASE